MKRPLKFKQKQYSKEEILFIIRSIKDIAIDEEGCLDTWVELDEYPSSIQSYIPGSFTYELLELIEKHMLGENKICDNKD